MNDTDTPYPVHRLWPERDPEWVLVFWFQRIEDRSEMVGFEMKSVRTYYGDGQASANERTIFVEGEQDPDDYVPIEPKPIRAVDLRAVPLTSESHAALSEWRAMDSYLDAAVEAGHLKRNVLTGQREQMGSPEEDVGGRRRWTGRDFEVVADLYREARQLGVRHTNVWVADELGALRGEDVSRKQAERLIYRARHEYGLLGEDE